MKLILMKLIFILLILMKLILINFFGAIFFYHLTLPFSRSRGGIIYPSNRGNPTWIFYDQIFFWTNTMFDNKKFGRNWFYHLTLQIFCEGVIYPRWPNIFQITAQSIYKSSKLSLAQLSPSLSVVTFTFCLLICQGLTSL